MKIFIKSKSGNYIVTGDEFGTINIWDQYGEFQDITFDVNDYMWNEF